ncbi:branched-chain amino acid ABC transporter permease/ATP-binding protein [Nonomuraea angiospora]|uniref:branched-chain amino acid ABC transporter permease/ATP-binding protein n=1 Tax=Nonomuraea angiospora TaxID=46172 RepID=UPI003327F655
MKHAWRVPLGTAAALAAIIAVGNLLGLESPPYVVVLGMLIGVSYGLLGVCLTLIFRVSRVINLAQHAVGLLAMAFMPLLVQVLGLPWWIAFVAITPIGFAVGALTEAVVIRPLVHAPRVVGVVASLGAAGLLASAASYVLGLGAEDPPPLPAPPGLPEFQVGPLVVSPGYTGLIISAPILTAALTLFLTRSKFGLAVRASATSTDNARLAGISPVLVSGLAWGLAGLIGTLTSVFFLGDVPSDPTSSVMSTATLLPALGAAAIAGFTSLPRALAGGIVIGVVQQIMLWSPTLSRYVDLALLLVLFGALMFSRRARLRGEVVGSWVAVTSWRPLPAPLARLWMVRNYGRLVLLAVAGYVALAATRDDTSAQLWTTTVCIAVVSLSVVLITGLGGELSLGQFGFAMVGAGVSHAVVRESSNFLAGLLAAGLAAGIVSVILAYPSLRARGLTLTILSLAFAVTVPTAFLADPRVMGFGAVTPQQPVLGGLVISAGVPYFLLAALIAGLCALLAWNVWRGGFGRQVRAARDNEAAAESFGIAVLGTRVKLLFVTGLIAGIAGAVLMHSYTSVSIAAFPVDINIRVVLAVVIGGVGILYGGPLGVLWLFASGVAQSSMSGSEGVNQAASLAIYSSVLVLILIAPGGAAQLLQPLRDLIAIGIGRLHGLRYTLADLRGEKRLENVVTLHPPKQLPVLRARVDDAEDGPLLECRDLRLSFGAVTAVGGLDLTVGRGEILGLIGPNGAGKTSTFELISGFARPDSGSVRFDGRDVTGLPPHRRAELGLIRSFQDAQLFPTMSTVEVITLALERQLRTNTAASILGIDLTVRKRHAVADEVIDYFGLTPYRESRIIELSTGCRRFVELAALISMQPRLLLLDEPSSGIAQRECEALGPLLHRLRQEFDLSMVIIEHDVPLVLSLSDRVLAMAEGRQLALGTPAEIRADSRVIDSYLGDSPDVLHRSNQSHLEGSSN